MDFPTIMKAVSIRNEQLRLVDSAGEPQDSGAPFPWSAAVDSTYHTLDGVPDFH